MPLVLAVEVRRARLAGAVLLEIGQQLIELRLHRAQVHFALRVPRLRLQLSLLLPTLHRVDLRNVRHPSQLLNSHIFCPTYRLRKRLPRLNNVLILKFAARRLSPLALPVQLVRQRVVCASHHLGLLLLTRRRAKQVRISQLA